ncbi:type VI secretion system Vgr family protein [Pseudoduganella ginsengisoli]|uniref:type VI secretion system Vgr family protein n=1 Tax=Pseudoduganella ginsengisoli TaxID=1462440 RepID=UPI001E4AF86C|nr:type VI secretion system Vgr family protein [Pseudoduganella ginsengisoli]
MSQHARLITLASAQDGALPESLMAEHISGREAVNELFAFDVHALSTSASLDLAQFIGEELTVTLLQPDGSRRAWHGLCTEASWLGADGGVARYCLRLEPALALLKLRRDSYIFQDRTVQDVVTELLSDYPQLRFSFDLTQPLAPRAICTQYRESDFEFFQRLLASEGLSWRFEHDPPDVLAADGQARHALVIFDSGAQAPAMPGGSVLRFHGVRATDTDDAIDTFAARRSVQANAVSIASWDPQQLLAPSKETASALDAGELPEIAIYDGSGERIKSGAENSDGDAGSHSTLMLQALELRNKQFDGAGAVRRLAPGYSFQLTQHERYGDGADGFTVLSVQHEARNNVESAIAGGPAFGIEPGTYRNCFTCVRDTVAIVPDATALPHTATALGPQTALVVGLAGAVSTTDRDHQVRIQFAWQRGANANAGGMPHNTEDGGCAPGDERSGTWVRVAEALAGPNWGSQFTPRVGTEVLVDFIEGDIDRPVIVAQLYTGNDVPPFSAGEDSSANHAGTLSGIQSRNFDGSGFNQWQLDDTQGQLRMRLATSCAATQLNLGYLVEQSPGSAQRGSYRGSGFELRTDAWAVVRGGEGVLLTTSARNAQGSSVTSTQMDAADALRRLQAAQTAGKQLFDAAAAQQALSSKDAAKAQEEFIAFIDPRQKGKFDGPVNGQPAFKAQAGSREPDSAQPVEKFGAPLVLMDAAASVNWATPASTVLFAGKQVQWSAQGDVHMAAAHTVSTVAGKAAGLFTLAGGIKAIAGNGPVSLQAHTDKLEILADQDITVISVNDCIDIKASKKIVLQAGQSSVTLDGGDIAFACPGNFTVKGGKHEFAGGASNSAELASLPTGSCAPSHNLFDSPLGPYSLRFAFAGADAVADIFKIAGKKFLVADDKNTKIASGTIGPDGRLPRVDSAAAKNLTLHIGEDKWSSIAVEDENMLDDGDPFIAEFPEPHDPYFSRLARSDGHLHFTAAELKDLIDTPGGEE